MGISASRTQIGTKTPIRVFVSMPLDEDGALDAAASEAVGVDVGDAVTTTGGGVDVGAIVDVVVIVTEPNETDVAVDSKMIGGRLGVAVASAPGCELTSRTSGDPRSALRSIASPIIIASIFPPLVRLSCANLAKFNFQKYAGPVFYCMSCERFEFNESFNSGS